MRKEVYNNGFYSVFDEKNIISMQALKGGAAIVPITRNNNFILIKVYRENIQGYSIEIPRGFVETSETSIDGAKRELYEEISGIASDFLYLGSATTNNGISNEIVEFYVAKNVEYNSKKLQKDESIVDILEFSLSDLIKMISNNEIIDSFTLIALMKYLCKFNYI